MDLGSLDNSLSVLLEGASNHEFSEIVRLLKIEQLADLGGTLGSKTTGNAVVSDIGDLSLTLLDETRLRTERSAPTMHPRTDLRLRSPWRRGR